MVKSPTAETADGEMANYPSRIKGTADSTGHHTQSRLQRLQKLFTSTHPRIRTTSFHTLTSAHIEVPNKTFWVQNKYKHAVLSVSSDCRHTIDGSVNHLLAIRGGDFVNACYTLVGAASPALLVFVRCPGEPCCPDGRKRRGRNYVVV